MRQPPPVDSVGADPLAALIDRQIQELGTDDMDTFLNSLDPDLKRYLPPFQLQRLIFDRHSGWHFDPLSIAQEFFRYLLHEVLVNGHLLGQLIVIAVIAALLRNLSASLAAQGAQDVAFAVSFLLLLFIGFQAFRVALGIAHEAVMTMVSFMQALLPMMATMLAAVGAVTTAALFHPLLISIVTVVATFVGGFLFPLVTVATVVGAIGNFSEVIPLSRLSGFIRQWGLTLLGFCFTLFGAILAVRGAIAPVADGVALRTAKFLTGAFVPIVGGQLAGALDVVVGGSALIKNAIGVYGMIGIFVLTAFPVLKICSILIIFRIATLIAQPITEPRLVDALGTLSGGIAFMLACLLTVSLMFFVSVTVLISAGNVTAVMR